jgi:hypothetical protein
VVKVVKKSKRQIFRNRESIYSFRIWAPNNRLATSWAQSFCVLYKLEFTPEKPKDLFWLFWKSVEFPNLDDSQILATVIPFRVLGIAEIPFRWIYTIAQYYRGSAFQLATGCWSRKFTGYRDSFQSTGYSWDSIQMNIYNCSILPRFSFSAGDRLLKQEVLQWLLKGKE